MILVYLILILLTGGLLAWLSSYINKLLPRIISLIALAIDFYLTISIWINHFQHSTFNIQHFIYPWIPQFGISFHLSMDGLSLLLILLTIFLGIISVLVSWKEIDYKVGFFHFNMLWILAGIMGV